MKIFLQFILFFFFLMFATAFTQVVVVPDTTGTNLEQYLYCGNGIPGGFKILGNMKITETLPGDFISSGSLLLFAPRRW